MSPSATLTVSGELRASHGELLLDGELLDDALADLLDLPRNQHGGLVDARVGRVVVAVVPPARA